MVVVFFDGVCGLCNGLVDFLLRRDRLGALRFAPLQGETARRTLAPSDVAQLDTLLVQDGETLLRKSDAILRAVSVLGGAWRWVGIAYVVPRTLRDRIYDLIARHRYRWFGQRPSCRLPAPGERDRFLA